MQLAWLRSLIIVFNFEISLIMRSNGANLQVNQDSTQLAHAVVTCRNIKCLLIQLLIEVLCLCQVKQQRNSTQASKGEKETGDQQLDAHMNDGGLERK